MDVEQVHVSIVGPGTVSIGWASESGRSDVVEVQEVDEHQAPLGDLQRVSSTSDTYELQCGRRFHLNGPCAMSQRYRSPLLLQARVTLEAGRKYRYRLGGGAWRRLRLPPKRDVSTVVKVAMVGDIGQTSNSAATCRDIRAHADELDLGVILGDLSYADSNASRWDSFHRLFDLQGCADLPWLVLPGNHEIEPDDLSGEDFVPYRKRWRTPQVAPEVVSNDSEVISWLRYDFRCRHDFGGSWYSFSTGPAHFVALNPYCTNSNPKAPQIQWLDEDLKGFSRERTPFLVVLTHAPWVHSSRTHRPENEVATAQLRASAEPLLAKKMDLMFSGHVHAYERSKPVEGTRYIVLGHGGNNEKLYNRWMESQSSAFRSGDHYGWGILTLSGGHGSFQARRSLDGAVMDSFEFMARMENEVTEVTEVTGDSAAFWAAVVLFCLGCGLCLCCCLVYRHARLADEEEKSSLKDAVTLGNAM